MSSMHLPSVRPASKSVDDASGYKYRDPKLIIAALLMLAVLLLEAIVIAKMAPTITDPSVFFATTT